MKTTFAVAALAAITLPAPLTARPGDGNDLMVICEPENSLYSLCLGQIAGYVRAFSFAQVAGMGQVYCMPSNATTGQAIDIVVNFLKKNPAKRHAGGEVIFLAALSEAWPCEAGPATLHNNGGITLPNSSIDLMPGKEG